ncbi:polymorphic toxin type 47 domain-containing protein [Pseudomonas helleri]|uniref:polymorphic toxin type 47 domain-containing protein n=1 Tax=Pseudomonas helleri TaxID=1608996 RepID=UPI000AADF5A3|nr:polymorphic toxin type 47 domain-containing protein [Pseudomonas helleri]
MREPSHENGYHIDRDPLWQHQPVAKPFNAIAWYQCDHLGTPMELTDQRGEIAWSATYQAWGLAKEKRTDSAIRENIRNPLRFQGQYFDTETGLHYNRYRYYDPQVGRFISKDPIGFAGGLNVYAYAPNPVGWVDPFGLAKLTHAPDFDTARVQALKNAGMTNPENVTLSKYDPVTGTVVEFKGEGGAKVAYDAPHADMDPKTGHDKPHIGWQTSGKRGRCGCAERGNITYDGPQHPHRPDKR